MEVCLNRAWGSVCGDFDRLEAIVFCNQLDGFSGDGFSGDGACVCVCVCLSGLASLRSGLHLHVHSSSTPLQQSIHISKPEAKG